MKMKATGEPISLSALMEFEDWLSATLPEDYCDFLIRYNGGRPFLECFYYGNNNLGDVVEFFCCNNGERNELIIENDVFSDVFPKGIISIGSASSSDRICMRLDSEKRGEVYVWYHDMGEGFEWSDAVKVANSFDEFCGILCDYVEPEDAESGYIGGGFISEHYIKKPSPDSE